jgi:pimeloyl-ACP methyl ester carboxylesterase
MTGQGMFSQVDLPKLGMDFQLPVFFIHGTEDLVMLPQVARAYVEGIRAPLKQWISVPHAGHDPNQPFIDAQYQVMQERVRPLAHEGPPPA